jgi:uncharacterized protein
MSIYRNGLRFECVRCSKCCRHEPGFVFLSENDVELLLRGLAMDRASFIGQFCVNVPSSEGRHLSLAERPNFDCIFWADGGCKVYEYRPMQCRSYPFWINNVVSGIEWNKLRMQCPGIDRGRLHSAQEIDEWLRKRKDEHLILYATEKEDDV